ncbi:MAG: ABC transporter ATP-binding protein, partial [Candidatus Dormibacteria bacterium]
VLDGVDLDASRGEVVGLIGTNGAGKTTLMNVISGLVGASGQVELEGEDITGRPPHLRARLGLGRAFQDARLFGGLSLMECVQVALEVRHRSELVPSMLALPPSRAAERRTFAEATDIVALLGLGRYADAPVTELSTGTRRIAELACLVALGARVLLLDEPTAGIAQREAEAFGPLIRSVQAELDATVVIIEHDIPLVLSISDRVYCLEAGRVIAEGLPEAVRNDPRVISSYLGTDDRVIQRSGTAARR